MVPDDYWSRFFGLTVEQFRAPGWKVVAHTELADYNGAWIFKLAQSVIVSVPAKIRDVTKTRLKSTAPGQVLLTQKYAEQLFENVDLAIGPCYQGYYSRETNGAEVYSDEAVRLLSASDQDNLDRLRQRVDPEAWEHSSIAPDKATFGYFQDGQIVAAACLDMWTDKVANMGLITLPSQRGKGCAQRLCTHATKFGLKQGYLMLYQTLLSNAPAVAVAKNTGYLQYATHLAIRFKTV